MSYFDVAVLVKKDGQGSEQIAEKADAMLGEFDIEKNVEQYKHYIDDEELANLRSHYHLQELPALAEKLKDWDYCESGGVDEQGLYILSTRNPKGHIDGWGLISEVTAETRDMLLFGKGQTRVCRVVITPSGEWIVGPSIYPTANEDEGKVLDAWIERMKGILEENKDCAIILAQCHL